MFLPKLTILSTIIVFASGSPELNLPESCVYSPKELTCHGRDLTPEEIVQQLKQANLRPALKTLTLKWMKFGIFDLHLLDGISLQSLVLTDGQLEGITDADVVDVTTLTKISILNSIDENRTDFELDLQKLRNINRIILQNNYIKIIRNDWFGKNMKSLRHLTLSRNKVESIEDEAFKYLWNLAYLDLSENLLTDLPNGLFSGLTSLNHIDLRRNRIQHLPQGVWKSIWPQLTFLMLKGNPIDCSSSIEWIAKYEGPAVSGRCIQPRDRKYMKLSELILSLKRRNTPASENIETTGKPQTIFLGEVFKFLKNKLLDLIFKKDGIKPEKPSRTAPSKRAATSVPPMRLY